MIRPPRIVAGLVASVVVVSILVATGAAAQPGRPKVLLLGDSVIEMICTHLPGELDELRQDFDVTCDGHDRWPFRRTSDGPALIRDHAGDYGDHLVLELGYNDGRDVPAFAAAARTIMEMPEVRAVPHVYWLTMRDVTGDYGGANDVLRGLATEFANLTLLDWHAVSVAEPRIMTRDGIHLTEAGADALAGMITDALVDGLGGAGSPGGSGPKAECSEPHPSVRRDPHPASARGYYLLDSTGLVHTYGDAPHHGDVRDVASPPISMQTTATGDGYWIVTADGRVRAFGAAVDHGDIPTDHPDLALAGAVRRLEPDPAGDGYWLMASDGGIFAFGPGTGFHGSVPGVLAAGTDPWGDIVSVTSTVDGDGYFVVGEDGGVFTFGSAEFLGSVYQYLPAGRRLDGPVIALSVHPAGAGYWLYALDGGVFGFGDVGFHGSMPGLGLCEPPAAVAMRPTATGSGYWVVTDAGWVIPFGDAEDLGGEPDLAPGATVVDMAVRR